MDRIRLLALKRAVPLTIRDLVALVGSSQPRAAAIFAHEELSVRLAQQHARLGMLPFRTPLLQRLQAETVSQITTSLAALRRYC